MRKKAHGDDGVVFHALVRTFSMACTDLNHFFLHTTTNQRLPTLSHPISLTTSRSSPYLPMAIIRHYLYLNWLQHYNDDSFIYVFDFRDTVFQATLPFASTSPAHMKTFLSPLALSFNTFLFSRAHALFSFIMNIITTIITTTAMTCGWMQHEPPTRIQGPSLFPLLHHPPT